MFLEKEISLPVLRDFCSKHRNAVDAECDVNCISIHINYKFYQPTKFIGMSSATALGL